MTKTPAFASSTFVALRSGSTAFVCGNVRTKSTRAAVQRTAAARGVSGLRLAMTASLDDAPEPVSVEDCKLFVGNLSWDTTDHTLGDAFSRYGTVVAARVIVDKFTGKSRGFGFIEYESAADADDALEGMQGMEVDGRRIRVDRANKRAPRPPRRFEEPLE